METDEKERKINERVTQLRASLGAAGYARRDQEQLERAGSSEVSPLVAGMQLQTTAQMLRFLETGMIPFTDGGEPVSLEALVQRLRDGQQYRAVDIDAAIDRLRATMTRVRTHLQEQESKVTRHSLAMEGALKSGRRNVDTGRINQTLAKNATALERIEAQQTMYDTMKPQIVDAILKLEALKRQRLSPPATATTQEKEVATREKQAMQQRGVQKWNEYVTSGKGATIMAQEGLRVRQSQDAPKDSKEWLKWKEEQRKSGVMLTVEEAPETKAAREAEKAARSAGDAIGLRRPTGPLSIHEDTARRFPGTRGAQRSADQEQRNINGEFRAREDQDRLKRDAQRILDRANRYQHYSQVYNGVLRERSQDGTITVTTGQMSVDSYRCFSVVRDGITVATLYLEPKTVTGQSRQEVIPVLKLTIVGEGAQEFTGPQAQDYALKAIRRALKKAPTKLTDADKEKSKVDLLRNKCAQ